MQGEKRRCCICSTIFTPHPKVGNRQKTCEKPECKRIHKQNNNARWQRENTNYDKGDSYGRLKAWLDKNPGYLKQYRQEHPEYVQKNRDVQKLRERLKKCRLDIQAKLNRQPSEIMSNMAQVPSGSHLDIQAEFTMQPLEITLLLSRFVHFPCLDIQAEIDFTRPILENSPIKQVGGSYGCKMVH